jgi:hypothetical protein
VTERPEDRSGTQDGPRHASARRSRGMATWVWAVPVTVVVVIAVVIGWLALSRDDEDSEASGCLAGDLGLLVWADPAAEDTARSLVDAYAATGPVVHDYCVQPQLKIKDTATAVEEYRSTMPGVAPVWLPAGTELTAGLAGAPEDPPVVGTTAEGLPVPLVAFGSSPMVQEDQARAASDFSRASTGGDSGAEDGEEN